MSAGRGRRLRGSTKDVQQIFQDIRDLRELRDVEDELGIIKKILDKQQTHVGKMQKEYGERIHLTDSKGVWYLDEAVNMIDRQHEQITRMLENLQVTIKGVSSYGDYGKLSSSLTGYSTMISLLCSKIKFLFMRLLMQASNLELSRYLQVSEMP